MALKIEGAIYRVKLDSDPQNPETEEVPGTRRAFLNREEAYTWLEDREGLPIDRWKTIHVSDMP